MFDFVNYTYSGIVSVLSALFGLSYPLLIGCIEKIDAKYGSTSLINRFKEESIFIKFKRLIVINLIVAILFPFLMDGCKYGRYFVLGQSILAILMVYKAFELFTAVPKLHNCAQAVADGMGRKDLVLELAACGGGRAPEGLCGALHSAPKTN